MNSSEDKAAAYDAMIVEINRLHRRSKLMFLLWMIAASVAIVASLTILLIGH